MEIFEQKCKSCIIKNKISKTNKSGRAVMMNEEFFLCGLIQMDREIKKPFCLIYDSEFLPFGFLI